MAEVTVVQSDITTQEVDAVVNAANNRMRGGGGVDGAIHRAGGPAVLEDCVRRFPHGLATGDAGWTTAGELPAQWVIHVVGPNYAAGQRDRSLLISCYSRALEVARQQGKIGKGVDAVVFVPSAPEEQWRPLLETKGESLLTTLFNVSGTRLKQRAPREAVRYESQDIPGLVVEVAPAQSLGWRKCERCWTWSARVGEDAAHPTLCERCTPVVAALAR